MPRRVGVAWKDVLRMPAGPLVYVVGTVTYPPQDAGRNGARKGTCAVA